MAQAAVSGNSFHVTLLVLILKRQASLDIFVFNMTLISLIKKIISRCFSHIAKRANGFRVTILV